MSPLKLPWLLFLPFRSQYTVFFKAVAYFCLLSTVWAGAACIDGLRFIFPYIVAAAPSRWAPGLFNGIIWSLLWLNGLFPVAVSMNCFSCFRPWLADVMFCLPNSKILISWFGECDDCRKPPPTAVTRFLCTDTRCYTSLKIDSADPSIVRSGLLI